MKIESNVLNMSVCFCRKSPSTSESVMFGLTEEERLAKEEEERNVALVEIQLRDEHSFPALGVSSHSCHQIDGCCNVYMFIMNLNQDVLLNCV